MKGAEKMTFQKRRRNDRNIPVNSLSEAAAAAWCVEKYPGINVVKVVKLDGDLYLPGEQVELL